jgi:outer membrane protein TolC
VSVPQPLQTVSPAPPVPFTPPAPAACDKPLPINLPTALQLAQVRPVDVALASQRIRLAAATLERARVLWLPTLQLGTDYFRHDGRIQDVAGNLFDTSKSSFMVGAAPIMIFSVSDALLAPLVERQVVRARQAALQTTRNDTLLAVAEAYFNVQQARGELAGAEDTVRRSEDLLRRTEGLAKDTISKAEVFRVRSELAARRQAVATARERWRTASAELTRVLRLDAAALVQPLEPAHLRVTLVPPDQGLDDLIAVGLTYRPELAEGQALVQATLQRLRQERLRPLVPSVLLRGASTNPAGTLAGGVFGGGVNDFVGNFGARGDFDVQVLWQLENLGLGNRGRVKERRAENQIAMLELFRTQDRVAAEVAQAFDQVQSATTRMAEAEGGLRDAAESADLNFQGLKQFKTGAGQLVLIVRPQEAVAAVQALAQAYNNYYGAVADYDRAQFRLYRALGHPAQLLADQAAPCPDSKPTGSAAIPSPSPESPPDRQP